MNPDKSTQSPPATLKEKAAKGLFWGGVNTFFQQFIGAILGILALHVLNPDDYGLMGMLAIFTAIATGIMDSGFGTALINKKDIRHEDYNAVFWFSAITGTALYVIFFFASPLIAHFYHQPLLTDLSRLAFLSFLINSFGLVHNAYLFKTLMAKERAKIDITAVSISGVAVLVLAINGFSYWSLAIQSILQSGISVLLRWHYTPWKPTLGRIDFSPLKTMFGFGSRLFITNIFTHVNIHILSVILGKYHTEEQVGYYTQGSKWMQLVNFMVYGMITSVALPVFVETNNDKERQCHIFRKMIRFGAFISFPSLFGLAFVSREFILIFAGEKWVGCIPFLQVLCLYGGFFYLISLYIYLLYAYGKSGIVMWYNITISAIVLCFILLIIPYGIFPAIVAYVVILTSSIFGWHYFARKLIALRFTIVLKDIFPYLFITLFSFGLTWLITLPVENIYVIFFLKIIIAAAIYLLIMKYSGSAVFQESVNFLLKKRK
ncbi:MAG: lipopolysaccharide biosynthesis protein [Tannerellaceae bacterium]|jgi:O-antigen/teichoic acid export membrane protein|nr:lipopolysaccharide biosynthesis protein [Tannerellaceae bacterium]